MHTQGSETSQYLEEKKAIQGTFFLIYTTHHVAIHSVCHCNQEEGSCDSHSSGERNGNSPNRTCLHVRGCRAKSAFSCRELQNVNIAEQTGKFDSKG